MDINFGRAHVQHVRRMSLHMLLEALLHPFPQQLSINLYAALDVTRRCHQRSMCRSATSSTCD